MPPPLAHGIDAATGSPRWRTPFSGMVTAPMMTSAVADGVTVMRYSRPGAISLNAAATLCRVEFTSVILIGSFPVILMMNSFASGFSPTTHSRSFGSTLTTTGTSTLPLLSAGGVPDSTCETGL